MKIYAASKLKEDFHRDTYWTKIDFKSDDGLRTSTVFVCASYEYLSDLFKEVKLNNKEVNKWYKKEIIRHWEDVGNQIFKKSTHYDVYATTPDGKDNGLNFLKMISSSG